MATDVLTQLRALRESLAETLRKDPRYLTLAALDKSIVEIGGVLTDAGLVPPPTAPIEPFHFEATASHAPVAIAFAAPEPAPPAPTPPAPVMAAVETPPVPETPAVSPEPVADTSEPAAEPAPKVPPVKPVMETAAALAVAGVLAEIVHEAHETSAAKPAPVVESPEKSDTPEHHDEPPATTPYAPLDVAEADKAEDQAADDKEADDEEAAHEEAADDEVETDGGHVAAEAGTKAHADGDAIVEHHAVAADDHAAHHADTEEKGHDAQAHEAPGTDHDEPSHDAKVEDAGPHEEDQAKADEVKVNADKEDQDAADQDDADQGDARDGEPAEPTVIPRGKASGYMPMQAKPGAAQYQPAMSVKFGKLPNKVDLRPLMTPVEDQGDTSSCVANAVAGAYEYWIKKASKQDHAISRLFVYYNARWRDGSQDKDEGSVIQLAMEGLSKFGACSEKVWPFDPHLILKRPGADAYQDGAPYKVHDMAQVPIKLEAWKQALAEGKPIVFGCELFESFDECSQRGGVVPMPAPDDIARKKHSGHSMCAVGYSDSEKVFIVRNSWGADFGDKGYCYMPFAYLMSPKFNDGDCWVFIPKVPSQPPREVWSDDATPVTNGGDGVDFPIETYTIADYEKITVDLFEAVRKPFNGIVLEDFSNYVSLASKGLWSDMESFDFRTFIASTAALAGIAAITAEFSDSFLSPETLADEESDAAQDDDEQSDEDQDEDEQSDEDQDDDDAADEDDDKDDDDSIDDDAEKSEDDDAGPVKHDKD